MKSGMYLAIGAVTALSSMAHAEPLDVKTGLWETTWVTQTRGLPPLPKELLDRMSPEQRKKMEADIRAEQAEGPDTNTDRDCITQRELERPFEPSNTKECTHKIVVATKTAQEVRIVCTGGLSGSGLMKVSAQNRETLNGSMELKLGEGPQSMTINAQLKARWLGSDCGDEADDEDTDMDADAADADADAGDEAHEE